MMEREGILAEIAGAHSDCVRRTVPVVILEIAR